MLLRIFLSSLASFALLIATGTIANGSGIQVETLKVEAHSGAPIVEFRVSGSTVTTYSDCRKLINDLKPVLIIEHSQGRETLVFVSKDGLKVETIKVHSNALECKATVMTRSQYKFNSSESKVIHSAELVVGDGARKVDGVSMLNRDFVPEAPTIVSPQKATNVKNYFVVKFSSTLHPDLKLLGMNASVCPVGQSCSYPTAIAPSSDGLSAEIFHDATYTQGKSIRVTISWEYENAVGAKWFVESDVVLNSVGADNSLRVTPALLKRFYKVQLRTELACSSIKANVTCSVTPTFTTPMDGLRFELPLKYATKAEIQTSTNRTKWTRAGTVTIETMKRSTFKTRISSSIPRIYLRLVPLGIQSEARVFELWP